MICPQCQKDAVRVIDSRDVEAEPAIRRRRECERCGFRFTTYERIETPNLWIVKKDGRREAFDRSKLARGIWRACEKRPISESQIEQVVDEVEKDVHATGESEIPASLIGEQTMKHLRELDEIAYIRFASVYRQFTDLGELHKEVTKTLKDSRSEKPTKQPVTK